MENSNPLTGFPSYLLDGIDCDIQAIRLAYKTGENRFPDLTQALIEDIKRNADMLADYSRISKQYLLTEKIQP